jgi:hypothetical protein
MPTCCITVCVGSVGLAGYFAAKEYRGASRTEYEMFTLGATQRFATLKV